MAKAIFYDRKHNCEVSAEQVCGVNVVVTLARTQDDYEQAGRNTVTSAWECRLGELGYKSEDCPEGRNWDRWINYSDLVFLRFE